MTPAMPGFRRASLGADFGYVPGDPAGGDDWLRLNTNESPLPASARVTEAITEAAAGLRRYPHPLGEPLRSELAAHHDVAPENVVLGNGADDVLNVCFRAFCEPGDRVVLTEPTYPLLGVLARVFSVDVRATSVPGEGSTAFGGESATLRVLVNPNAPTGTWIDPGVVAKHAGGSDGVVVIDEAYGDFAPASCIPLAMERDNWLVVRTFSKGYALAGLRVGYAVGSAALIRDLEAVKDVYPVDRCALAGAGAALADRAHHGDIVATVIEERAWLTGALEQLGWDVLPSRANFVFARPPGQATAMAMAEQLRERHILVRHFPAVAPDRIRITCGTREQNQRLLGAVA